MKPLVSVLIPTFNSSGTLRWTLESVIMQDYSDFEVWVVGDGCTDDSSSVVANLGDSRLKWINLPENTGAPNTPRNEGIKRASGVYIAYLGHDDLWFPWHLSGLVECIRRGSYDMVYSPGAFMGPDGVDGVLGLPEKSLNPHWQLSPSNWLHRKSLMAEVGGWPSGNRYAADLIVLRRIWKTGAKIGIHKEISVLKFASSVWRNYDTEREYPQEVFLKTLAKNPEELRLTILRDILAAGSTGSFRFQKKKFFRTGLRKAMIFISNIYGIHRWPVNQLLRWKWRRDSGLKRKKGKDNNVNKR